MGALIIIIISCIIFAIVVRNKSGRPKVYNESGIDIKALLQGTPFHESYLKYHIEYLRYGAWRDKSAEADIKFCVDFIKPADALLAKVFPAQEEDAKKYVLEVKRRFDSAEGWRDQRVLQACNEFLDLPNYQDFMLVKDMLALWYENCDVEHSDDSDRERTHIELYNRIREMSGLLSRAGK